MLGIGNLQCILLNNRKFLSKKGKNSEFSVLNLSHLIDQNIWRILVPYNYNLLRYLQPFTCWRAGSLPRTVCTPPSAVVAKSPADIHRK
jgi:hypothetical protein